MESACPEARGELDGLMERAAAKGLWHSVEFQKSCRP